MAYLDLMVSGKMPNSYGNWTTYSTQIGLLYNLASGESDGTAQGNNPIPIPTGGTNLSAAKLIGFNRGTEGVGATITNLIMWCNTASSSNSTNISLKGTVGSETTFLGYPFTSPVGVAGEQNVYDSWSTSANPLIFASNSNYVNITDVAPTTLGYFYLQVGSTATAYGTWQLAFTYQYRVS